ncbi:MAG: helix-turn-helix transcriptional regulator [Alphaproteobacteria bacterium]|nr:helix-turn-helix transcriptional regulator [Alphaproteobacteria bacterium]
MEETSIFRLKKTPGVPNPIDIHVGERVRLRRTLLGMSQEKLGGAIGLTFQQIQKYERGLNRIGASRLWSIAKVLNIPISFFFEDMQDNILGDSAQISGLAEDSKGLSEVDPMNRKQTLELVRAFYRISDPKAASLLLELVKVIADAPESWSSSQRK